MLAAAGNGAGPAPVQAQVAVQDLLQQVVYCTVLYCTLLYCTVLYCTVLYCTVLS